MLDRLARLGREINLRVEGFGHFARFCGAAGYWTLRQPAGYGRLHLLLPQLYTIGVRSIPVVMLVGAFVGAVIGIETYAQFASFGQETRLGGVIALSVVKQIGPVLAAVMIAGRVGGAVSAEVGTMRVTEQLDALRVMGTDPVQHLVVPRVLACVIMLPILTAFSSLFIGLIACYKGFNCESGAAGVGKAATQSFVLGFIAIIISNFFLAQFLNTLAPLIDGLAAPTAADAG